MQSALVIGSFAGLGDHRRSGPLVHWPRRSPVIPTWGGMLAINVLGDALRDNLDPKLKRSGGRA